MRGEPIRRDKLVLAGEGGFMSAILPAGMRAVAIKSTTAAIRAPAASFFPTTGSTSSGFSATTRRRRRAASKSWVRRPFSPTSACSPSAKPSQEDNGKKVAVGVNATLELSPNSPSSSSSPSTRAAANLHLLLRSLVDSGGEARTADSCGERGGLTIMRYGAPEQAAR